MSHPQVVVGSYSDPTTVVFGVLGGEGMYVTRSINVWDPDDFDRDMVLAASDCDDSNDAVYPGAPEIADGLDNQCPGDPGSGLVDEASPTGGFTDPLDKTAYGWDPVPGATSYRIHRSSTPTFEAHDCTSFVEPAPPLVDVTTPPPGAALFYLHRVDAPVLGSPGADSEGVERSIGCS